MLQIMTNKFVVLSKEILTEELSIDIEDHAVLGAVVGQAVGRKSNLND